MQQTSGVGQREWLLGHMKQQTYGGCGGRGGMFILGGIGCNKHLEWGRGNGY